MYVCRLLDNRVYPLPPIWVKERRLVTYKVLLALLVAGQGPAGAGRCNGDSQLLPV